MEAVLKLLVRLSYEQLQAVQDMIDHLIRRKQPPEASGKIMSQFLRFEEQDLHPEGQ